MIFHISQQRFDFIKSQGYGFRHYEGSAGEAKTIQERPLTLPNDTEFHVLDGEYAFCETCGSAFDSVDANSPSELETIKATAQ